MANAVTARQYGDEYQQLVFWKYALKMLSGNYGIKSIRFEDDEIKSYDDVVIDYLEPQIFRDWKINKEFVQVKFHVRDENLFTLDNLIDPSFIGATKNSLLDNVCNAYHKVGVNFHDYVFTIYSMWDIAQDDVLNELVSNVDRTIDINKLFDNTTCKSRMGIVRKKLCDTLEVDEDELKSILTQVRIKSRQETIVDLKEQLNQKLEFLGLKVIEGDQYTNSYTQLIQELNKSGRKVFTKDELERELRNEGLFSPQKETSLLAVRSFRKHAEQLDEEANCLLALENYFDDRFLKNEYNWNSTIYPLLQSFVDENCIDDKEYYLQLETNATIAFALGRILDIKAGKEIVPIQRTENGVVIWKKIENKIQYPSIRCTEEILASDCNDVAIIIGITRKIENDVKECLEEEKINIGRIVNIQLETCDSANIIDGTHAWKIANDIKNIIDGRKLREKREKLHIFLSCPNTLVFLLGRYSLSFGKIQFYEYDFNKERSCSYYLTMCF